MLNMLAQGVDEIASWPVIVENLKTYGVQATVIGIAMVFIILALLIGIIYLVRFVIELGEKNAKKMHQVESFVEDVDVDEDGRVAAAITAAIAMMYEAQAVSSGEKVDFVVRNIKRIR